jgi:hypothetical protein
MLEVGVVTRADCKAYFKTVEHAPPDALRAVYARVKQLVEKSAFDPREAPKLCKGMILSMQGFCLKRFSLKWRVARSTSLEDRLGPIQRVKPLDDGSMLQMSSTERLNNSTMYLVGLLALHKEHVLLAKLRRSLRPRAPVACRVDCLYCAKKDLKRKEAGEAVGQLRWPDDSAIFRIVDVANDEKEPHANPLAARDVLPKRSRWRCYAQDVIKAPEGVPEEEHHGLFGFGALSVERRFALRTEWRVRREPAVEDLLLNGGGMVLGRGGIGKSTA